MPGNATDQIENGGGGIGRALPSNGGIILFYDATAGITNWVIMAKD